jgi:hypothetical protein
LLFIGIHNAWDGVAYHVFTNKPDTDTPAEDKKLWKGLL